MRPVVLVSAALGCGESHRPPVCPCVAGIEGSMRPGLMTDAGWLAFCEWREGLVPAELVVFTCDGATPVPTVCMPGSMPPCTDWSTEECMSGSGLRGRFTPDWCDTTVLALAACLEARAGDACGDSPPECASAFCVAGPDAGHTD